MPDTQAVFFWMVGVVTQAIEPLLCQALTACGQPGINLPARPGFADDCEGLALGKLDGLAFCREVNKLAGVPISDEALQAAVIAAFAPTPGVIQAIDRLPPAYRRVLIVDVPRGWFELVRERLLIHPCFPSDGLIFLPECGLTRLEPDVYDALAARAGLRLDKCLVLDLSSHRAVAALDHGLPSAIFVDAPRLEREWLLRQFTARVPLEHRPASVIQPPQTQP
jgi:hypothetical protein